MKLFLDIHDENITNKISANQIKHFIKNYTYKTFNCHISKELPNMKLEILSHSANFSFPGLMDLLVKKTLPLFLVYVIENVVQ